MSPSSAFLTILFVCLCQHSNLAVADEVHTLPSGRRVPRAAILSHPFGAGPDAAARLYELSDDYVLSAHGQEPVHLAAHKRTVPVHHHPDLHVELNGRSAAHADSPGEVREGDGFEAAYLHGESLPTEVVLRGVTLMPLHFGDHPGVYIAAPPSSSSHGVGAAPAAGVAPEAGGADLSPSAVARQGGTRRWCGANAAKRNYEIAAAFDNTLCALYDHHYARVLLRIQLSVGWANDAFEDYLCLRTALVHVEAHCKDPSDPVRRWPRSTTLNLLARFQNFWQKSRGYVQRDIAIFFTTVSENRVYLDSSCSKKIGYAIAPISKRAIASSLAYSLGARRASTGLMAGIGIKLAAGSAQMVRNFLEFNGKSWCITQARRVCTPKNCQGRCENGTCVTGKLNVPQKCAATLNGNWQLQCTPYRQLIDVPTLGDTIRVRYALQYGRLYMQFSKLRLFSILSLPAAMAYVKIGSWPTLTEGELDIQNTLTLWFNIADLPNPRPGKSCCGQTLYVSVKVLYCAVSFPNCITKTRQFTWKLPCNGICKPPGSGKPLPMNPWRKCPVCKRG